MKKRLIIPLLLHLCLSGCSNTSESFQYDADTIRLNHIHYYGQLFDEYEKKTGKYPLMGKAIVPIYSFVASSEQRDDIKGGPPYAHKVIPFKDLINELETVLERDVSERYDPQYSPDKKPNFYIYMVDGNTYNFAVHTNEKFNFSNQVAPGYNKIEITNNTNGASHLITFESLINDPIFLKAKKRKISKPAFFESRELKHAQDTKLK